MAQRTNRRVDRVRERVGGLGRGLTTLPDARGWAESLALAVVLAAVAAPLALAGGLIALPAHAAATTFRSLAVPFVVPSFVEECVFRGLLLPHPRSSGVPLRGRARWWLGSLIVYVGIHPLSAALLRPAARGVFDAPAFLAEAALLGVAATALYERTGSLWPAVVLHGAVVAVWLNLGGARLLGG